MRFNVFSPNSLPLTVLVLVCLLTSRGVLAKKELETAAPTFAPTTESTYNATLSPTNFLFLNETTLEPLNDTTVETAAPTRSPGSAPVATPATPEAPNQVQLPVIGIDIVLGDEQGTKSAQELEDDMRAFVAEILATNSGVDTFDYAVLNFDVILSSFSGRRLSSGVSLRVDGTAYYGANAPSSESLSMSLWTYFAVWGIGDLETYLHEVGLPSARVAAVKIDDEIVKPAEGSQGYSPGATLQQPTTERDETVSPAVIAGLAAACTVIVLVLAFLLCAPRNRKSQLESRSIHVGDSNQKVSPVVSRKPSERKLEEALELDEEKSVADMSVDMSIYTTDNTVLSTAGTGTPLYDTRRLERIITMGKNHVSNERLDI